jgi:hypothetical protein
MADKRKAVGGGPLTHTLHVWPTDEVTAQSADWPAWWYQAYERAARQLADRVACCILGGLPDCPEPIRMELLPSGRLTFSVYLSGTTIEVLIWHFEGPDDPEPDAPGPDGGKRRTTADGLVLFLRGTGKDFSVAPFYDGLVPPVPVGRARPWPWPIRITTAATTSGNRGSYVTAASWVAAMPRMAPAKATERHESIACWGSATGVGRTSRAMPGAKYRPAIAARPGIEIEMRRAYRIDVTHKGSRLVSRFSWSSPELFRSERPPTFSHALSEPIYGPSVPDRHIRQGKVVIRGGNHPAAQLI